VEKWKKVWMRQVLLFGEEMQDKLRKARILVVGVGGLGCFVSILLARLGVGRLVLWDRGTVDPPDLHSQILYGPSDLGRIFYPIPVYPVTVSIVATIQVNETMQMIAGSLPVLAGKMLLVDLRDYEFELVDL